MPQRGEEPGYFRVHISGFLNSSNGFVGICGLWLHSNGSCRSTVHQRSDTVRQLVPVISGYLLSLPDAGAKGHPMVTLSASSDLSVVSEIVTPMDLITQSASTSHVTPTHS